jgi:serine/threonine protein phosphatase PrpC
MDYATALDVGKRKREQGGINEDSVAANLLADGHRDAERHTGVFVIADGAGGAQGGDVASYVATVEVTRRLTDWLWSSWEFDDVLAAAGTRAGDRQTLAADTVGDPLPGMGDDAIQRCLADAIEAAHTRLIEVINDRGLENSYSTIVAAVAAGDRLHYGWVGDSRAYVVNVGPGRDDDQRLTLLTKDHSEVEELVSRGSIDEIEAQVHRRGNRITRALGGTRGEDPASSSVAVDTASVPLFGDDAVLLTSDGLIDAYTGAPELHQAYEAADDTEPVAEEILNKSVTDDEIRDIVLEAPSLEAATDRFVELSNARGGKDNVSLVLFRDERLPDAPAGSLPLREYDPDTERVLDWDTVKRVPDETGTAVDPADHPGMSDDPGTGGPGTDEFDR